MYTNVIRAQTEMETKLQEREKREEELTKELDQLRSDERERADKVQFCDFLSLSLRVCSRSLRFRFRKQRKSSNWN